MKDIRLCTHKQTDKNGLEIYDVQLQAPKINDRDLWDGGRFLTFCINHKRNRTTCHQDRYKDGAKRYYGAVRTWKDTIFGEKECLEFAEKYHWDWK